MDCGLHKQKALKRQKVDEEEDKDIIMKMLPESLVSKILSFLPTKDAARTNVLSKRWKHQWLSITSLDLNDTVFYSQKKKIMGETHHFVMFVYRALLLTQCSILESFTLVIGNYYDLSLVNNWISSALKRKLKKLCIHSELELPFSSDTCNSLFNSELLEELDLSLSMYWHPTYCNAAITVPTSYVHWGLLKSLKLSGITFIIESSDNPKFSFPLLQKYEAIDCTWVVPSRRVIFEVPMLETLFMELGPDTQFFQSGDCCFEFAASHLKELSYSSHGYVTQYITELDPSSLCNANACIILYQPERDYDSEFHVFFILKQFSQVKYLKFEGSEVMSLSKVALLPSFGVLNHLELGIVGGEVLIGLLLKSPVLKSLIFKGLGSKIDQELLNSASVPDCLHHTLEGVKFGKVKGLEHELCVAKFLMRNGLVLKKMSFFVVTEIRRSKAFEDFKEKLLSVKKGSNLAVEFSHV